MLYLILFVVSFCFLHWLLFKDREKTPKRQQSSAVDRDYKLRAEYESKFKKPSRPEYMPKALKAKLKTRKLEAH